MKTSIKNTKAAVLQTIYKIIVKHKSTWCYTKRSTIRKYVKKYYGISVSLSDISYHLWDLRKCEYINVYTRYKRINYGRLVNLPSNRQITGKGISWLKRYGVKIKNYLYNWAFNGVKPPRVIAKYKPHPTPNTFTRPSGRVATGTETLNNLLSDT